MARRNSAYGYGFLLTLSVFLLCGYGSQRSHAFGKLGFEIHHRFSDPVTRFFPVKGLPEKGSVEYYAAMVHRDRTIRSRRLSESKSQTPLTFFNGNETDLLSSLGYLHYVNVSVGTPSSWYLVALDSGSSLFWLPCDCISCVKELHLASGLVRELNIYSPNSSSTSKKVPCSSPLCSYKNKCHSPDDTCPYEVSYIPNSTLSSGLLVEDILHLTIDRAPSMDLGAEITLGCGKVQTGLLLEGTIAPNGLFGLGMGNLSVPSRLASDGLASDSFSLCFGLNGVGRIRFGDQGTSGQSETGFNLEQRDSSYNISITQISVGRNASSVDFTALFDSSSFFTQLNEPAYSLISDKFDSLIQEKRISSKSTPFEYCYELSSNETVFKYPKVNLTMRGGDPFFVIDPLVLFTTREAYVYCLGVTKSKDINIIGQNFMFGYHIVYDREKMVLGWKESNCYDDENSNHVPISPSPSPAKTPITTLDPQAPAGSVHSSPATDALPPSQSSSTLFNCSTWAMCLIALPFLAF